MARVRVRVRDGNSLTFMYEPGTSLQREGVTTHTVTIEPGPEGSLVEKDEAKVALSLYPNVKKVTK